MSAVKVLVKFQQLQVLMLAAIVTTRTGKLWTGTFYDILVVLLETASKVMCQFTEILLNPAAILI